MLNRHISIFICLHLGIPSSSSPEHVIFIVKDMFLSNMSFGKHGIALTESSLTSFLWISVVRVVFTNIFSPGESLKVELIFYKFSNALISVFSTGAFQAIFVFFTNVIELKKDDQTFYEKNCIFYWDFRSYNL